MHLENLQQFQKPSYVESDESGTGHLVVISPPWERLVAPHILSTISMQQSLEKNEKIDAYHFKFLLTYLKERYYTIK
jgi:hypothetical protein